MSLSESISQCRRLGLVSALSLGGLLAATGANAADPLNGKTVYQANCAGCHNANPALNQSSILNGANNPTKIQSAITNNTGGMGQFSTLSSTAIGDIAAYLGTFLPAPVAALAPSSLTFAGQTVGTNSAAQTFTLSNTGNATLSITSITSSSPEFPLAGGTCMAPGSVVKGASCTVSAKFAPTATGTRSGSVTIAHNASGGSSTVGLSGTGQAPAAPAASVSPTALSFSQTVGTTSAVKTVTLSNSGTAPLLVSSLTLGGTNASEFALGAGGSCAVGGSVAAGTSCSVVLSFTPALASTRSASLAIGHNATGSPTQVALNGTGTAAPQAVLSLNKNTLTFADQPLTTTSAAQAVTVSNTGTAPMSLSSLTLAGTNPGDFSLGGTCSTAASVAAAGSCTVSVSFAPTATAARSATVAIASNASNGAATISLGGNGTAAPAPAVSLAPLAVDFASVTVGSAAVTRAVSLTNSGSAPLGLGSISVIGNGYSASNNCGTSLAVGASCSVTLSFAPASAGSFAGQMSVASNAVGSPHAIALSGLGVLPPLPVLAWSTTATSLAFADTAVGNVAPAKTLTLTNKGPGSVTLTTLAVQGAMATEFPIAGTCGAGQVLAAAASCTVTVAFSPAAMGARNGSLSVSSSGSNPVAIALSGNGVAQAVAELTATVATLAFQDTLVGRRSAQLPVTLRNTGSLPVTITSARSSSTSFDARFAKNGVVLQPGAEYAVKVWFAPEAVGTLAGKLEITHSASPTPLGIALSGAGLPRR